jgi:cytochrome oxidase Cu insertion factor (SCO1/SenC/PrrC family)
MTARPQVQVQGWLAMVMWGVLLTLGSMATSDAAGSLTPPLGLAAPAQPAPIPAFSLVDSNGTTVRSADLQDKVVLVRFWATW